MFEALASGLHAHGARGSVLCDARDRKYHHPQTHTAHTCKHAVAYVLCHTRMLMQAPTCKHAVAYVLCQTRMLMQAPTHAHARTHSYDLSSEHTHTHTNANALMHFDVDRLLCLSMDMLHARLNDCTNVRWRTHMCASTRQDPRTMTRVTTRRPTTLTSAG